MQCREDGRWYRDIILIVLIGIAGCHLQCIVGEVAVVGLNGALLLLGFLGSVGGCFSASGWVFGSGGSFG